MRSASCEISDKGPFIRRILDVRDRVFDANLFDALWTTSERYGRFIGLRICRKIGLTVVFGTTGLLFPKVPLLIWLPSLLLLCSSCVSLSALIYLNKGIALRSRDNLLYYILLTVVLIIF
ncbi:hypothetical protein GCK32_018203, partial [Trichostrongylus colubriformis]